MISRKSFLVMTFIAVLLIYIFIDSSGVASPEDHQLHLWQMGNLLYRCSNINMIYGIGLKKEQLDRLIEISRIIEAWVPPMAIKTKGKSEFLPVVENLARLYNALKEKKEIPESFRIELMKTREKQSELIRKGLRYNRKAPVFSCQRCHAVEGEGWLSGIPWWEVIAKNPGIHNEQAIAHFNAPFGLVGILLVWLYADEIDSILTNGQKAMVSSFTCCLIPPQEMANPVRVGQAEVGDWEIPLLEKIRNASKLALPFVRIGVKNFAIRRFLALKPDGTKSEQEQIRERIDKIIDKVRALSDVDFNLKREELAIEIKDIGGTSSIDTERKRKFNTAYFLLMPGAREIFEKLRNSIK